MLKRSSCSHLLRRHSHHLNCFLKPTPSLLAPSVNKKITIIMPRRTRNDSSDSDDVEVVEKPAPKKPANSAAAAAAPSSKSKKLVQQTLTFGGKSAAGAPAGGGVELKQHLTDSEWSAALAPVFASPTVTSIQAQINGDIKKNKLVFPPRDQIFTALNCCPLSKVKVVIIGQDPYHDVGQAHGLCFSVLPGVKVPPSLRNIYKELEADIPGFVSPTHGYLQSWAEQGILMLNATLTVRAHEANSHEKCGWQDFTDSVIDKVNQRAEPAVFLLWGNFAKKKAARVDRKKHRVIENAHPSPLSQKAWFGCKAFSKCNDALADLGLDAINWSLPAQAVVKK